jgi:hypothetical protein
MRHIKTYENFNHQDALEEIKSVFQDIIDDYNLQELPDDLDYGDFSRPGIYYHLSNFYDVAEKTRRDNGTLRRCQFELTLYCPTDWTADLSKEDTKYKIWSDYLKIITSELGDFKLRLETMGYRIKFERLDLLKTDDILEYLIEDDEFTIEISLDSEKWGSDALYLKK